MKETFCTAFGMLGAALAAAFGGWDAAMTALMVCISVDYISGSIVALVFHASRKSETGAYNSAYGLKGLCKKGLMLLFVLVAVQIDKVLGTEYARDAVCIGFCANEIISIIENAGLMGLPIPEILTKSIDQLMGRDTDD